VCGHREYAPTRKEDPEGFGLDDWRWRVSTGNIYGGSGQQTGWCSGWFQAA